MIAVGGGYDMSLERVREAFLSGYTTKDNFEEALRAHEEAK